MPLSWTLLPDPSQVRVSCLIPTTNAIIARAESITPTAVCPLCGRVSTHAHSRYVRSVAATPWQNIPFQLQVRVRKFFCDEPTCKRRIFTERLPGLVAPSARRTVRLTAWLCTIGFALGGQGGGRLLRTLRLVTPQTPHRPLASPATLLRLIRATPDPVTADPPCVVGVDDWCFLRGQR